MTPEAASGLAADVAAYVEGQSALPLPLVTLETVTDSPGETVRGRVLTLRQAEDVALIAARHGARAELAVLADPAARLEQGWLDVVATPLEVWRDPRAAGEDAARQSEYLPGDGPLRLLGEGYGALLVQGPDLTVGWVAGDGVGPASEDARSRFDRHRRAIAGMAVPAATGRALTELLDAARAALGAPYRWGGTTPRGYDCSGLVQRVFADATGVLLPKHTGDQRHVGIRVTAGEARAGDLLLARPVDQNVGHVLLVTGSDTVLHACRTEARVIEEGLEDNARRYRHQGYRRPVELVPPPNPAPLGPGAGPD